MFLAVLQTQHQVNLLPLLMSVLQRKRPFRPAFSLKKKIGIDKAPL